MEVVKPLLKYFTYLESSVRVAISRFQLDGTEYTQTFQVSKSWTQNISVASVLLHAHSPTTQSLRNTGNLYALQFKGLVQCSATWTPPCSSWDDERGCLICLDHVWIQLAEDGESCIPTHLVDSSLRKAELYHTHQPHQRLQLLDQEADHLRTTLPLSFAVVRLAFTC